MREIDTRLRIMDLIFISISILIVVNFFRVTSNELAYSDDLIFYLITAYFYISLYFRFDFRIPLLAGVLLLIFEKYRVNPGSISYDISIYGWYFVAIGVYLGIWQFVRFYEGIKKLGIFIKGMSLKGLNKRNDKESITVSLSNLKDILSDNFKGSLKLSEISRFIRTNFSQLSGTIIRFLNEYFILIKSDYRSGLFLAVIFVLILIKGNFQDPISLLILLYFISALIFDLDSRYPIIAAIFLLFFTAIQLVQKNEELANQMAIYAYYFLVVGVLLQLIEYIKFGPAEEGYGDG